MRFRDNPSRVQLKWRPEGDPAYRYETFFMDDWYSDDQPGWAPRPEF